MLLNFSQPSLISLWLDESDMALFWDKTLIWDSNMGCFDDWGYLTEKFLEDLAIRLLVFEGRKSCGARLLFPPDDDHPVFLLTPYPLKEIGDWYGIGQLTWEFDYSQPSDGCLYAYPIGTQGAPDSSNILDVFHDPNLAKQQPKKVLTEINFFDCPPFPDQSVKNLYGALVS